MSKVFRRNSTDGAERSQISQSEIVSVLISSTTRDGALPSDDAPTKKKIIEEQKIRGGIMLIQ